jgi:hypothetical protein
VHQSKELLTQISTNKLNSSRSVSRTNHSTGNKLCNLRCQPATRATNYSWQKLNQTQTDKECESLTSCLPTLLSQDVKQVATMILGNTCNEDPTTLHQMSASIQSFILLGFKAWYCCKRWYHKETVQNCRCLFTNHATSVGQNAKWIAYSARSQQTREINKLWSPT